MVAGFPLQDELEGPPSEAGPRLPSRPPGARGRSALFGCIAGGLGGPLALVTADALQGTWRLGEHLRLLLGQVTVIATGATVSQARIAVAASLVLGAVVGAAFGGLTRRLHAKVARLVFGVVLLPSVWIAVDAFLLGRFAPRLSAVLPFLPWLAGAAVYGAVVALARPATRPSKPWLAADDEEQPVVDPSPANSTATFPLVRRRRALAQ